MIVREALAKSLFPAAQTAKQHSRITSRISYPPHKAEIHICYIRMLEMTDNLAGMHVLSTSLKRMQSHAWYNIID